MDNFLYRLTLQPIIKGAIASGVSFLSTGLLYFLFAFSFGPFDGLVDFWFQTILLIISAAILCYVIVYLKFEYSTVETMSDYVGEFWSSRARVGKRVPFILVRLAMLSHVIIALALALYIYFAYPTVLDAYKSHYGAEGLTVTDNMLFYVKSFFTYYIAGIFAITFALQYINVNSYAQSGRCHVCGAAFSLTYVRDGGKEITHSSNVSSKERKVAVAEKYEVTLEDDVEVDRRKVDTIYETAHDYYRTDTKTTHFNKVCHCGVCKSIITKSDSYSTSTTTKL